MGTMTRIDPEDVKRQQPNPAPDVLAKQSDVSDVADTQRTEVKKLLWREINAIRLESGNKLNGNVCAHSVFYSLYIVPPEGWGKSMSYMFRMTATSTYPIEFLSPLSDAGCWQSFADAKAIQEGLKKILPHTLEEFNRQSKMREKKGKTTS